MIKPHWLFFLLLLPGAGCQQQSPQQREAVTAAYFEAGPKLVKISITEPQQVEQLLRDSIEVIVVEPDYVIARIDQSGAAAVQNRALSMVPARESELVQRLVQVVVAGPADVQTVVDMGIDTWEIRGDTVLARAYDRHIRQIRERGFTVTILEPNAANVLKKLPAEK